MTNDVVERRLDVYMDGIVGNVEAIYLFISGLRTSIASTTARGDLLVQLLKAKNILSLRRSDLGDPSEPSNIRIVHQCQRE